MILLPLLLLPLTGCDQVKSLLGQDTESPAPTAPVAPAAKDLTAQTEDIRKLLRAGKAGEAAKAAEALVTANPAEDGLWDLLELTAIRAGIAGELVDRLSADQAIGGRTDRHNVLRGVMAVEANRLGDALTAARVLGAIAPGDAAAIAAMAVAKGAPVPEGLGAGAAALVAATRDTTLPLDPEAEALPGWRAALVRAEARLARGDRSGAALDAAKADSGGVRAQQLAAAIRIRAATSAGEAFAAADPAARAAVVAGDAAGAAEILEAVLPVAAGGWRAAPLSDVAGELARTLADAGNAETSARLSAIEAESALRAGALIRARDAAKVASASTAVQVRAGWTLALASAGLGLPADIEAAAAGLPEPRAAGARDLARALRGESPSLPTGGLSGADAALQLLLAAGWLDDPRSAYAAAAAAAAGNAPDLVLWATLAGSRAAPGLDLVPPAPITGDPSAPAPGAATGGAPPEGAAPAPGAQAAPTPPTAAPAPAPPAPASPAASAGPTVPAGATSAGTPEGAPPAELTTAPAGMLAEHAARTWVATGAVTPLPAGLDHPGAAGWQALLAGSPAAADTPGVAAWARLRAAMAAGDAETAAKEAGAVAMLSPPWRTGPWAPVLALDGPLPGELDADAATNRRIADPAPFATAHHGWAAARRSAETAWSAGLTPFPSTATPEQRAAVWDAAAKLRAGELAWIAGAQAWPAAAVTALDEAEKAAGLQRVAPPSAATLRSQLDGDAILSFRPTSDGVETLYLGEERARVAVLPAAVERNAAAYLAALRAGESPVAAGDRLRAQIIDPAMDVLLGVGRYIVVGPAPFDELPIAAMPEQSDGLRYLASIRHVGHAPDFSSLVPPATGEFEATYTIVAWCADPTEANAVRRVYPDAVVLEGPAATVAAWKDKAPRARFLHLGALPAAPGGGFVLADGTLTLEDLATTALGATTVVVYGGGKDATGLARANALRRAGADEVMVEAWASAPNMREGLLLRFWEGINRRYSASRALSEARMLTIREVGEVGQPPGNWAGYYVAGRP